MSIKTYFMDDRKLSISYDPKKYQNIDIKEYKYEVSVVFGYQRPHIETFLKDHGIDYVGKGNFYLINQTGMDYIKLILPEDADDGVCLFISKVTRWISV